MVGSRDRKRAREAAGSLIRAIAPVVLLGVGWTGPGGAAAAPPAAPCVIASVADAVGLELQCAGGTRMERLRGLRAPRPGPPHAGGEPFAAESRRLTQEWLTGARVELADGVARLDGEDLRLGLLARGLAVVEPASLDPADLAALRRAEREARSRGLGAWSHAAWRTHRASVTEPIPLAAPTPPPAPPPLALRAARPGQPSWEERKAAFEAALRELERAAARPPRRR